MKVALFLDVDQTLTKNYIQKDFATMLDCVDDYEQIESDFQKNQDADEFGTRLISLFREKGFTSGFASENYRNVDRLPWTDRLLRLNLDIFLVSNGPSDVGCAMHTDPTWGFPLL